MKVRERRMQYMELCVYRLNLPEKKKHFCAISFLPMIRHTIVGILFGPTIFNNGLRIYFLHLVYSQETILIRKKNRKGTSTFSLQGIHEKKVKTTCMDEYILENEWVVYFWVFGGKLTSTRLPV